VYRARAGDERAQRQLFEIHLPWVHALAFRMAGSIDIADDFAQDTFVRAFERLTTFRGETPFAIWLRRVAVSVILNGLRSERRRSGREREASASFEHVANASARDPALAARLVRALATLSPTSRLIVLLHDLEEHTCEEVGQLIQMRAGAVRVRLMRARKQLRKELWVLASGHP